MNSQLFSKGQVALITGAALGIGRATAIEFVKRELSVAVVDLPGEDLTALVEELNSIAGSAQVLSIPADLAQPNSVSEIQSAVESRFGHINVLMNNAVTRDGRTFDGRLNSGNICLI